MAAKPGTAGAFRRGWIVWLGLFFFVCLHSPAAGQVTVLSRRLYLQADTLRLDVQLDSLFSRRALDAIASGMVTSILLEFRLDAPGRGKLLEQILAVRLEHDIWEGQYRVIHHASGPDTLHTADFAEVQRFCSDLKGIVLGPTPGVQAFSLRMRVGVNPISVEQEQRTRRWLTFLQKGSLLELFISLDRPLERTRWIDVGRFSTEDLQ